MQATAVRRARWTGIVVASLGAALHGAAVVASFASTSGGHGAACGALSTGGLTALVFTWALRARSAWGAAGYTMVGAIVAGGLNAGLAGLLLMIAGDPEMARLFAGVVVVGGLFGAVAGVIFGVFLSALAGLVTWLAHRPSRTTSGWLGLALGTWLGLTALALPALPYPERALLVLTPLSVAVSALAIATALLSAMHLAMRARWLARVRRGGVPRYAVIGTEALLVDAELPSWGPRSRNDAILVEERADDRVYRGEVSRRPLAYVSGPSKSGATILDRAGVG